MYRGPPYFAFAQTVFVSSVTLMAFLESELPVQLLYLQVMSTDCPLSLSVMLKLLSPNVWVALPVAVPLTDAEF